MRELKRDLGRERGNINADWKEKVHWITILKAWSVAGVLSTLSVTVTSILQEASAVL